MDPQACLELALQTLRAGRFVEARITLGDYRAWRRKGGFEPSLPIVFLGAVPNHGDNLALAIRAAATSKRSRLRGEAALAS